MTSSATDDLLTPDLPEIPSAEKSSSARRWLVLPLFLIGGLACGWFVPQWQTRDADAPDPFAALDEDAAIFLGQASSPDPTVAAGAAEYSQPQDGLELPVLPGWHDLATNATDAQLADPPAPRWAAYETVSPLTQDSSRTETAPVWLDGTIEFFATDDAPPRPLQQAFGPTSYQR